MKRLQRTQGMTTKGVKVKEAKTTQSFQEAKVEVGGSTSRAGDFEPPMASICTLSLDGSFAHH